MPTVEPSPASSSGGIHVGDVGGSVSFSALGDIVGGDKTINITTTVQISVEAITQRALVTTSPYRGLDRFEDRDKDLFFGRDQLIKNLLAQLGASNVLLVLGASGSGKSSVMRAGLLPALSQLIGARFRYFTFVPDVNPFESLRSALHGAGFTQTQTRELLDAQPETPAKLIHSLQREGDQWLFFVDQFEEIFTVCDEALRKTFISALVAIAQDATSSTKLALAMRADFLDRFSPFPLFAKIIEKNIDFVADMHPDELRLAIEQPAARNGVVFEPGLVEEIIKDVQGQAGSLPLLQYTLDLLWQEEAREDGLADRHLNTRAYRELGGVRGALQKRADEIYVSFGDGADSKGATPKQMIVRQIFLRLVDLAGEGSDNAAWRPVRRRAPMAMFTAGQEQAILQALINQKLLVSNREGDDATVEVAHEALFTSWGRLKNWIEAGKQVIFAKNRLADDARRWQRRKEQRDRGADEELLSGSRLSQADDMRGRGDFVTVMGGLSELESRFLNQSIALREKRAKLRRRLEIAGLFLLLLAVVGAIFGWIGQDEARSKANEAENEAKKTKSVLSQSDFLRASELLDQHRTSEALAFLARACRTDPNNRYAATRLFSLLSQRNWILPVTEPLSHTNDRGETPALERVRFNTDGTKFVATTWAEGEAQVWETLSGKLLLSGVKCNTTGGDYRSHPCLPDERSFSSREPLILIAHDDEVQVCNFNPGTPASLKHDSEVSAAQFSMDGATILTGCVDGKVTIWDTKSRSRIGEPLALNGRVGAFSRDGTRAITTDEESWVQLWKIDPGAHKAMPVEPTIDGKFLSISEDGRRLCFATSAPPLPLEIHFRDLDSGEERTKPLANVFRDLDSGEERTKPLANVPASDGEDIETSSFGRDSRHFVAMAIRRSENDLRAEWQFDVTGQVRVWDSVTGAQFPCMRHETHEVDPSEGFHPYQASLSPDSTRVASVAYKDWSLRVWESKTGGMANEPIRGSEFDDVTFSPDGRYILTASDSGAAQIWDIQPLVPIREPTVLVTQLKFTEARFSDDAKLLLLTNEEGQQQCFDVKTAQPTPTIPPIFARPISKWQNSTGTRRFVNIDPDESGDEESANKHLIDTATGKPLLPEIRVRGGTMRFSSDGKRLLIGRFSESQSELELRSAETGAQLREPIFDCSEAWFSPAGDMVIMNTGVGLAVLDIATGRELSDRIKFLEKRRIAAATLTSDGVVVATLPRYDILPPGVLEDGRPELYHFDFQLNHAPALLADIAEGVAQRRLNEIGAPEPRYMRITKLREMAGKLDEREAPHAFVLWARWFLTPRENRPIAPDSERTLREYIQECIDRGSDESLREAALLAVGDKELLAKIAAMHAKQQRR